MNLRQYSVEGSFKAFQTQLPRLKKMGVEILWFMPIYPIGQARRKGSLGSYYSISNFTSTNPEFGSPEEFKELVKEAHRMGMKIILDWVANHAAWDNIWTVDHPEYFERDDQGNFKPPYDWDDVIQIDHKNEAQQQAMKDAMLFWIREFDIDGFRADLAHLTPLAFWIDARRQVSKLKHDLVWLAETEEIDYHQAFDISFTWQWMHATEEYCKGIRPFSYLVETLNHYNNSFPTQAVRMWFTSNHDENSWNGTAFEKYGDYVKALTVFNATYPGMPLVYSGEETGLNKRLKFFDKDVIDWQSPSQWEQLYHQLFALRKSNPVFSQGSQSFFEWLPRALEKSILGFKRKLGDHELLVLINMNPHAATYVINETESASYSASAVDGNEYDRREESILQLSPGGFILLEKVS